MVILCVDDHPVMLNGLCRNVKWAIPEADVYSFTKADAALAFAAKYGCDILFCEIELYNHGGIGLAGQIRKMNARVNIIFVTVCSEKEYAKEVMQLRPSGYLIKPATREQIVNELRNLRYPI